MDFTNINFLVFILYYNCVRCLHWEKGAWDLSCTFLCNLLLIYNYFKIKSFFKKATEVEDLIGDY